MTNHSSSFQKNTIGIIQKVLICLALLRSHCTGNSSSDIDLSSTTLDPTSTGFMIKGSAANDYFAYSISTAGDINNDGYDDIIIGALFKNAAYVIYGGEESSFLNIDFSTTMLNPLTTGFMITANAANDGFGGSVSAAGDIDGDGYDDIIVGAYGKNGNQGAAYVIYGRAKSSMSNIALSSTTLDPASTGFTITGNVVNYFGVSVSTAGDINSDGYSDIIIGANGVSSSQRGEVYVIYGGPKSSMSNWDFSSGATLTPSVTGFMITGNTIGDGLGRSATTAGDINSDGYDDIIVGASQKNSLQGAAYVIYGGPKASMSNIDLSSTTLNPSSTGFMITGNAAGDLFGFPVSTAGDFNNDGYDDIIIGASTKNSNQGAAYVIYGGPKSTMSNWDFSSGATLTPSTTGFMITGNAFNDQFGRSVSIAGDINIDGYDDIIVGAPMKNSAQGAAYVIYGGLKSSMSNIVLSSTTLDPLTTGFMITGTAAGDYFGRSVSTTGDINNDGSDDIIVGTYQKDTYRGAAYVIYGAQTDSCPKNCNKCSSESVCTECKNPYFLYRSKCLDSCPVATVNLANTCKDCPSYCSSCISQDSCQVCNQGFTLSNSLCVFSSQGAQQKATQAVSSAARGISSFVCVGSTVAPFAALVSKIVQNTRYLNLSVTSELSEIYQTWETDLISWNVPNVMSDLDHFETSPFLFAQYDVDSPFLVNFWPTLLNIAIGFGTFIACIFIQKIFEHEKYEGWAYSLVLKLVAGSFNFALVQAYACLDDILFYLVLDAKTNPFNSFFSWTSMICAVLFLALGCLQVLFNFWTVYKYQGIKNQSTKEIEAFNERNKYWELFYSDFNDDDFWCQSFFAIAIIRSALSSFIITVFYDYPLLQASYLVIIDIAILSFLYLKNPFNTLRGKLAQYYYEIITLLVHLCAFILGLQDSFENPSDNTKLVFSTGIIYLNTILIIGAVGFMFIEIYETIRFQTEAQKLKQHQSIPEDNQETQKLTQTAGPLQPSDPKRQDWTSQDHTDFYFFQGVNQKRNVNTNDLNMESNFNADDNSNELDVYSGHRLNQQRNQRTRPIMIRHRQQGNSFVFPSHEQFSEN